MKPESPHASSWTSAAKVPAVLALFTVPLLFTILLAAFSPASSSNDSTLVLPVEVFPSDGRSQTVRSITIHASNGSAADRIYFQMHQPFYHIGGWDVGQSEGFDPATMVDVRLNGSSGTWRTINNQNVTCKSPEEEFGCVGGMYNTITFSIPVSSLGATVDGANTIEFRFNGTEGVRSGFRVLHIGLMRSGDRLDSFVPLPKRGATDALIDGTTFEYWDPDTWAPPSGHDNSSSIEAGRALWNEENRLRDLDGSSMVASCGACHAGSGRDLQYFSFSNESIITRSIGHGLTETEGRQIAAYIRSLSFTLSDGVTAAETNSPGTPWDPPYQPGPTGFGPNGDQSPDEADPYYWAAGAGLEWALDTDEETLPYIFPASGDPKNPQGIARDRNGDLPWARYRVVDESEWGGNGTVDRGTAVNMRAIPVSMQFPDWNNWLPDIHPHDGLDGVFNGSNLESRVDNADNVFSQGSLSDIRYWIDDLNGLYQSEIQEELERGAQQTRNSLTPIQRMHARTSGRQWRLVKAWAQMHEYAMEDKADDFYCDGSEDEWCEPLGWLGDARLAFDIAPHVSGTTLDNAPFTYGTRAGNYFYSHAWYQMQMVINPGTPGMGGTTPTDEGYQEAFLKDVPRFFDHSNGYRMIMSEWKLLQIQSNDINNWKGPLQGNVGIDWILNAACCGATSSRLGTRLYSKLEKSNVESMIEAFIRASNAYMVGENGNQGRIATLPRSTETGAPGNGTDYPHIAYNPTPGDYIHDYMYVEPIYEAFAGNLYRQTTPFQDVFPNMSRGALDSLLAQGDLLAPDDRDDGFAGEVVNSWPSQTRWHDFVDYRPPEAGQHTIDLRQGWNIISSAVSPDDPSMEAVFSSLGSSLVLVKNETGESYIPEFNVNTIGSWRSDEAYKVFVTSTEQITVSGAELDPTSAIPLEEGWNLVAFWPSSSMPAQDAFASLGSALMIVKDAAGNAYIPGESINTLDNGTGQVHPGQGYQVYVSADANLTYPSSSKTLASGATKAQRSARGVASSASIVVKAPGLNDGTTVLAETQNGVRVGTGVARNGKALVRVWGNDPQAPSVTGAKPGEALSLRVPSRNDGERITVSNTRDLIGGSASDLTFAPDAVLATTADLAELELTLRDNYPNPVRSSTTIEFVLPAQQRVDIEVFDLLGRRVASVLNDTMPAGVHTISFDASRLSSGTYFYRMQTGGQVLSRKMVVVR